MKHSSEYVFHFSSIPKFCCVLLFVAPTFGRNLLTWNGIKAPNVDDWQRNYVEIALNSSFNIFGRGKFDRVFINKIGAVSFGSPIRTTKLRDVRSDTILFSPMLIDTRETVQDLQVSYEELQQMNQISSVQQFFRESLGDGNIVLSQALLVTYNFSLIVSDKTLNNVYQILLVGNKEKTYVGYFYNSTEFISWKGAYARSGIFIVRDGAIECSHEVVGSGSETIATVQQRSNVDSKGNFIWRVDLPLECKAFRSECGEVPEAKREYDLCPVGEFFETVTAVQWRFYTFYFCKAGRTMQDGSVTAKRECRYDADYYTYEWDALAENQKCNKRIRNFWSQFHSSRNSG